MHQKRAVIDRARRRSITAAGHRDPQPHLWSRGRLDRQELKVLAPPAGMQCLRWPAGADRRIGHEPDVAASCAASTLLKRQLSAE